MTETAKQIVADTTYAQMTQSIVINHGALWRGQDHRPALLPAQQQQRLDGHRQPDPRTLTECLYELAMELGMENARVSVAPWPAHCAAACSPPKA